MTAIMSNQPDGVLRSADRAEPSRLTKWNDTRTDHRETAEGYVGELFRRGPHRVAECHQGLQWLLQRRRPRKSAGGAAWDTLSYCVTRKALDRFYRAHTGAEAPEIASLPDHFGRGSGR
jgi:hypothetical protein